MFKIRISPKKLFDVDCKTFYTHFLKIYIYYAPTVNTSSTTLAPPFTIASNHNVKKWLHTVCQINAEALPNNMAPPAPSSAGCGL